MSASRASASAHRDVIELNVFEDLDAPTTAERVNEDAPRPRPADEPGERPQDRQPVSRVPDARSSKTTR